METFDFASSPQNTANNTARLSPMKTIKRKWKGFAFLWNADLPTEKMRKKSCQSERNSFGYRVKNDFI